MITLFLILGTIYFIVKLAPYIRSSYQFVANIYTATKGVVQQVKQNTKQV
jgi:hypothetical protein